MWPAISSELPSPFHSHSPSADGSQGTRVSSGASSRGITALVGNPGMVVTSASHATASKAFTARSRAAGSPVAAYWYDCAARYIDVHSPSLSEGRVRLVVRSPGRSRRDVVTYPLRRTFRARL